MLEIKLSWIRARLSLKNGLLKAGKNDIDKTESFRFHNQASFQVAQISRANKRSEGFLHLPLRQIRLLNSLPRPQALEGVKVLGLVLDWVAITV